MNYKKLYIPLLFSICTFSQEKEQNIKLLNAKEITMDEKIKKDLQILTGNVIFEHEGTIMRCDSSTFNSENNSFEAYKNVRINNGDTLSMTCEYMEYRGKERKGYGFNNVVMKNTSATLYTDEIIFDKNKNEVRYPKYGKIVDTSNVMESQEGIYFIQDKSFQFLTNVTITNPRYVIKSNNLIYNTIAKKTYFYGPSTIENDSNFIYCEKGMYDTNTDISYFTKNSYLQNKEQKLFGDSLYYDRNRGFGSANNNVKILDTLNNFFVTSEYAEFYELKDSAIITKRPVIHYIDKKDITDTLFMYSDTIMITNKLEKMTVTDEHNILADSLVQKNATLSNEKTKYSSQKTKIVKSFYNVKFYKKNLQGKCDSIYSNETMGMIKIMGNDPVIWLEKKQMTSDTIYLIKDNEGNIDSLKMDHNAFIIYQHETDTDAFNQIKGKFIKGKFIDNDLREAWVIGNAETIYYVENDKKERQGINVSKSARIYVTLEDNEISEIYFLSQPNATMYPENKLPPEDRKLNNFKWREDEMIKTKEDIFPN